MLRGPAEGEVGVDCDERSVRWEGFGVGEERNERSLVDMTASTNREKGTSVCDGREGGRGVRTTMSIYENHPIAILVNVQSLLVAPPPSAPSFSLRHTSSGCAYSSRPAPHSMFVFPSSSSSSPASPPCRFEWSTTRGKTSATGVKNPNGLRASSPRYDTHPSCFSFRRCFSFSFSSSYRILAFSRRLFSRLSGITSAARSR